MKAMPQGTKKEGKIFTIHNVNPSMIFSCSDFKNVIREQLNEEITPHDFEIGFLSVEQVLSEFVMKMICQSYGLISESLEAK